METINETPERAMHRWECRHHSPYEEICYLKSCHDARGGITVGCGPKSKCPRMTRYDNKIKRENGTE